MHRATNRSGNYRLNGTTPGQRQVLQRDQRTKDTIHARAQQMFGNFKGVCRIVPQTRGILRICAVLLFLA